MNESEFESCYSCKYFVDEDMTGNGVCQKDGEETEGSNYCGEWEE